MVKGKVLLILINSLLNSFMHLLIRLQSQSNYLIYYVKSEKKVHSIYLDKTYRGLTVLQKIQSYSCTHQALFSLDSSRCFF